MSADSHRSNGWSRAFKLAVFGLLAVAVVQELRKAPAERTWQGRVAGIPYDLRPPTLERLRAAYWNPDDPRIFTPRPAGLGWGVNVARLLRPQS